MKRLIEQTMDNKTFLEETIKEFKNVVKVEDGGLIYDITKDGKYMINMSGAVTYDFVKPQNYKRYVILKTGFHTIDIVEYKEELNTPKHYDNTKGTLYKVATERGWNSYVFDAVKRLERAEKKGEFDSDIDKTINLLLLYKKERNEN